MNSFFSEKSRRSNFLWIRALPWILGYGILLIVLAGRTEAIELVNPIKSTTLLGLIENIADAATKIVTPFAVVAIVIAGIRLLIAATSGDARSLGDAKKMFFWIIIGTAIVIGASILAKIAVNIVKTL